MFKNGGELADIFEFQVADDAAESRLSSVNDTAESKLSGVIDNAKSKLRGVIDTAELGKMKFCI